MTPIELVLIAFGGNVMLLAVLGYLAKSLMSQLLAKDLKHFETKLSQASAVAAEELKHSLSLVAHEHHVRFNHLHDKQAVVLEDIYAKLLEFEDASAALTLANNDTPENLMEFALNRAQDAGREPAQYIRKKRDLLASSSLHAAAQLVGSCQFATQQLQLQSSQQETR
jgi:hypothetical protein